MDKLYNSFKEGLNCNEGGNGNLGHVFSEESLKKMSEAKIGVKHTEERNIMKNNMKNKKLKLVVLTGAGISAESGIPTFRDTDGTWDNYNVEDVATITGWYKNPRLVNDFYNERRKQLATIEPNSAHFGLKELEEHFDVQIITQNVDCLHERAGSTKILHLHGELTKVCNEKKKNITFIGYDELKFGDVDKSGNILRPYVVWFGEDVEKLPKAQKMVEGADIVVVIGTSMQVYPAASLVSYKKENSQLYIINPEKDSTGNHYFNCEEINEKATVGVEILKEKLLNR